MIKCVIIDDEQPAIKVLEIYISRIPGLQVVGTATNPLKGLQIIKEQHPDVVFLDIQMEEMSGLEVMKIINTTTKVVFCTAFPEFAVDSYDLEAVDYLMKPIKFERFVKAVQKVAVSISAPPPGTLGNEIPNDYIFVPSENKGKRVMIYFDDIDYVESLRNYAAFYRGTEKTMALFSMKELEETLPASKFVRVHKSFLVAIKKIKAMEGGEIVIKSTNARIPLSPNYKEEFLRRVNKK